MSNHNLPTHGDHVRWAREHLSMKEDVKGWRSQLMAAIDQLTRCKEILCAHEEAMREHLVTLDRHKRELELHELSMISDEVGPFPSRDPMLRSHADESRNHALELEAHERMKRNYHRVASELRRLIRVLEEPA